MLREANMENLNKSGKYNIVKKIKNKLFGFWPRK